MRLRPFILTSAALLASCQAFLGEPSKPASITIEADSLTLGEYETIPIRAVVRDSKGTVMPEANVYWVSSDMNVAMVDEYFGALMASRPGTTTIEAHAGDVVTRAMVTVTRGVVKTVNAYPNRFVLVPGQRMQIYAAPLDSRGRQLQYRIATFASKNDRATVTPEGMVSGVAPGVGVITVTVEGVSFDVLLKVIPPVLSFDYYKRGGTTTAGTATLTFAPSNLASATLAIDGKSLTVSPNVSYDSGVTCLNTPFFPTPAPDAITACAFDPSPTTIRLCGPLNNASYPGQLQYVLLPANDTGRVTSTAAAVLSAVQNSTNLQGITVHTGCAATFTPPSTGAAPPRWVRNAPDTNYFLWPDLSTVHTAASVAARLDGAAIFSAPNPVSSLRFLAIRTSATVFEVWH